MTTINQPKPISLAWIEKQKEYYAIVSETLADGSPNPRKAELAEEIEQAEEERDRWDDFVAWVEENKGYSKTNAYAIRFRDGRETIEPGKAFFRKNADGTSHYLLVSDAWLQYLAAHESTQEESENGADYAEKCEYPVVWYVTPGHPRGLHVALLEETELPFSLADLTGEVVEGRWIADNLHEGAGIEGWKFRDFSGDVITEIKIVDNRAEWLQQQADYDAVAE